MFQPNDKLRHVVWKVRCKGSGAGVIVDWRVPASWNGGGASVSASFSHSHWHFPQRDPTGDTDHPGHVRGETTWILAIHMECRLLPRGVLSLWKLPQAISFGDCCSAESRIALHELGQLPTSMIQDVESATDANEDSCSFGVLFGTQGHHSSGSRGKVWGGASLTVIYVD